MHRIIVKLAGLAALAILAVTQVGCWEDPFAGLLDGFGGLAGGGFYDDGSWGNWLTGSYVNDGTIWGDGFYCIDGDCSTG